MDTAQALRAFEETLARHTNPTELGGALHRLAESVVGVKLFTLTAIDMAAGQVRRVYSSHEAVYPLLGTKPLVIDDWFERMRTERAIDVINTAEGMEGNFSDLELIRSLGCNASISVPIMVGNELLGTINALDAEGRYTDDKVEAAQVLILPAVTTFLVLKRHFAL